MDESKALSMLGLARRAGALSMGRDTCVQSIISGKAQCVIFCTDISKRLIGELKVTVQKHNPSLKAYVIPKSIEETKSLLGYKAGVITVNDKNFAKRITELINQEEIEW